MSPIISENSLDRIRLVYSIIIALISLGVFFSTSNRPYHKSYALSSGQVLANLKDLKGETIRVTGYVDQTFKDSLQLKSGAGPSIKLRYTGKIPPKRSEIVAKVHIGKEAEDILVEEIYLYSGITANRVLFSLPCIFIIAYLFLREFRIKNVRFTQRKNS